MYTQIHTSIYFVRLRCVVCLLFRFARLTRTRTHARRQHTFKLRARACVCACEVSSCLFRFVCVRSFTKRNMLSKAHFARTARAVSPSRMPIRHTISVRMRLLDQFCCSRCVQQITRNATHTPALGLWACVRACECVFI